MRTTPRNGALLWMRKRHSTKGDSQKGTEQCASTSGHCRQLGGCILPFWRGDLGWHQRPLHGAGGWVWVISEWSASRIDGQLFARGQRQVTVPIQVNSYCYPGALKFRGGNGWNSPSLCGLRMFWKDAEQSPASFPSRCFSPQLFPHFEAQGDREAGRCYDITRKSGLKDCLKTSKGAPRLGMGLCYWQIPVASPNCHPWNSFKGNGWTWIQLHKLIYKAELTPVCKALWATWIDFLNCLPKVLPHP